MTPRRPGPAPSVGRWERMGSRALIVEAAMVLAGGGTLAVGWSRGWIDISGPSVFLAAFAVGVAAALVAVAVALGRGARWPRGAALTWQVLHAAVALGSTGSRWWLAVALVAPVPFAVGGILAAALRTQREGSAAEG